MILVIYWVYTHEGAELMKPGNPTYGPVAFRDVTTGTVLITGSTLVASEGLPMLEADGITYPMVDVDVSSDSHPFWTGRQPSDRHRRPHRGVPSPVRRPGRQGEHHESTKLTAGPQEDPGRTDRASQGTGLRHQRENPRMKARQG
jgi:large subunit ribosomal protein L31